jgi:Methyltransferase domain
MRAFVPRPVRRQLRTLVTGVRLRYAIAQLARVPEGRTPSARTLTLLQRAWGNEGFAAKTEYLRTLVAAAATTPGPILECGSGVTTLLLAALAGRRGVEVWSLEHLPEWQQKVVRAIRRFPHTTVVKAALRSYGAFDWYGVPPGVLPKHFALVVCDGPPGATRGGRYGLLPILGDRLQGATVLLDDAHRPDEQEILARWQREAGCTYRIAETFAIITFPALDTLDTLPGMVHTEVR